MKHFAKPAYALIAAALSFASAASAHISLEKGGTHISRDGDANLKDGPCGLAGSTRGTHIYAYKPGQTITVSLIETIAHPSYFRFAFDNDGDDAFMEPRSIRPIDPTRPCPFNAADKCDSTGDFYNNTAVLPGMDDLDEHLAGGIDTWGKMFSWQVTLPNVTCTNCTLQVIQVMQDTIHGAYNPVPGDPADQPYVADIYHQCIDLVLDASAPGDGGPIADETHSASSSDNSSGCSMGRPPASEPPVAATLMALALAAVGVRRRKLR